MYKTCGYEIAISNNTRQFCSIFDDDTTEVMEYFEDLDAYYQNGYGYDINYQMGCLLWKEFLEIHQGYVNGTNTDLKAKLRFAHAETVMPLVCLIVCEFPFFVLPETTLILMLVCLGVVQRSNSFAW
jgi:multiple inositol-polyphosphate phosphatase / 2,3-bisphosphoglycerate 3-phosphatase